MYEWHTESNVINKIRELIFSIQIMNDKREKKMLNSFISKFGQNPQMIYPQWNEKKEKQQEKHSNNSQHPVKRVKTRETKNAQLYKALNRQLQYPRVCSCCESKETN